MQLVKTTDFTVRPYKLVNLDEHKDFSDFIEREEYNVLKKLLGITLYEEFAAAIDAGGAIAQKWTDLRDGAKYEANEDEITYKFEGMVKMIRPVLYALWIRDTFDKQGAAGVFRVLPGEDSRLIDPTTRIVRAYNDFSRQAGNRCNWKHTLYGFLHKNESTYPDWVFEDPGTMNPWNL